jgi:V8-like Glu-specific endopeptidase
MVLVELVAEPKTNPAQISIVSLSNIVYIGGERTICGPTDDRTLSYVARCARAMPIGCSSWIIDDANHQFLTAGHCALSGYNDIQTVEFNVPLSSGSGVYQHPGPEDQYATDPASFQFGYSGIGDDWAYFGCYPNTETGLTHFQAQEGEYYQLSSTPPQVTNQQITIVGYGTVSFPVSPMWNGVQKTHTGPHVYFGGTTIGYETDTTGGNSGSPVLNESTGEAIGIHTNGGCGSSGGNNWGCGINNSGLQFALANPLGVCVQGVTGACCINSSCSVDSETNCLALGGEYQGDGTTCESSPCNPPLTIDYPDGRPSFISPYGETSVAINITAGTSEPAQDSGNLHYKHGLFDWIEVPLVQNSEYDYTATFPYIDCGQEIDWFISVDTVDGDVVESPAGAPETSWHAAAFSGSENVFTDNFQSHLGWMVFNDAQEGSWVRGVPSEGGDRCDPPSDADGSGLCYVTGNSDDEDLDGGMTMLYSPLITLNMDNAPTLSYYRWFSNGADCDGTNAHEEGDVLQVDISSDGGGSFSSLETIGPDGAQAEGGWYLSEFYLPDVIEAEGVIDMQLMFTAVDDNMSSIVEAAVDGVSISESVCGDPPACYLADVDKDGEVGVIDLLAVIDQWGTGGSADVNGDGVVDVGDLLAIVDAWGQCP